MPLRIGIDENKRFSQGLKFAFEDWVARAKFHAHVLARIE